jgi:hypothetical protein
MLFSALIMLNREILLIRWKNHHGKLIPGSGPQLDLEVFRFSSSYFTTILLHWCELIDNKINCTQDTHTHYHQFKNDNASPEYLQLSI